MSGGEITELKQACIDMSNAALALFDLFDEHGTEALYAGPDALCIVTLQRRFEFVRACLMRQATARVTALGISPEALARQAFGYDRP